MTQTLPATETPASPAAPPGSSHTDGLLGEALTHRLAALITTTGPRQQQTPTAPWDGTALGVVPTCTPDDVLEATGRARAAQTAWAALPLRQRAAVFLRYHDLVLHRQEQLLDVVQAESGKARISAFEELADVAMTARYYARSAHKHLAPARRRGAVPGLTRTVERHVSKGVVGIISPWNYPLTLAVSDAVPALLAGNAVVLKPDSQTPFTALLAVELLLEAGLPRELFQVVTGSGAALGPTLIDNVDYLMFTGSTRTGRLLAEQCGRRLIGFSGELGGKNPMVVLDDADVDKAVAGAIRGCFSNGGQLCVSIERLYVQDGIYDRFVTALVDRVKQMRLGPGTDWEVEMGSLASASQLDTITRHVDDAVAKRARVLAGGRARPDLGALFYEPTLLEGVTEEMTLSREETFGPVVALYRVATVDEAVRLANETCYGLNASVWSTASHGARVAEAISAGTVNVNEGYAAAWASHDAPMGGVKDSGAGRRHGREGITKYTESQTVAVQRGLPLGPSHGMSQATYAAVMTTALRALRRVPFL